MKYPTLQDALQLSQSSTKIWYPDQLEYYPEKFWYYFQLCLDREVKVLLRDSTFLRARIGQNLLVGAIVGSLFSNIPTTDVSTMNGFLLNTLLFCALSAFAILPIVYAQKAVFYKQKRSTVFPTCSSCFYTFYLLITITND
jgi:hypothetical protein